jgi:GMP synthase-like glutamine amidotransferase
MGKRQKSRVAWRLAAVLTTVLLGAVAVLGVCFGRQFLAGQEIGRLSLAPRECWGFGRSGLMQSFGPDDTPTEWYVVGCFAWRINE